jgi:hypothetical protein
MHSLFFDPSSLHQNVVSPCQTLSPAHSAGGRWTIERRSPSIEPRCGRNLAIRAESRSCCRFCSRRVRKAGMVIESTLALQGGDDFDLHLLAVSPRCHRHGSVSDGLTSVLKGSSLTQTHVRAGFGSGMTARSGCMSARNAPRLSRMPRTGLVHGGIVFHVGEVDVHLQELVEAAPCLLQYDTDVLQSLLRPVRY